MEGGRKTKAVQGKLNRLMERKKQLELQKIYQEKDEDQELEEEKESRVGKKLAEIITIRVIILVLCLILILPLFSASYYYELETDMDQHLATLSAQGQVVRNQTQLETLFKRVVDTHKNNGGNSQPLILLKYENSIKNMKYELSGTNVDDLRVSEQ